MAARLKQLRAQRVSLLSKIQRIHVFAENIPDDSSYEAVQIRLQEARDAATKVKEIDLEIVAANSDEELDPTEFENNYYTIEGNLGRWIRKATEPQTHFMNDTMNATHQGHYDIRLPKKAIPTFSGNYMEWCTFYDLFCANIHDKVNLTPSQKFQHLRGYLEGEASQLVKHLRITDANYFEAVDKLRNRYSRKRQIVNSYIGTFLEQRPIQTVSAASIRKILDTSDEILRGLKAIGSAAEQRDPWITRLILNLLDSETKSQWAHESRDEEYPSIELLFKFLQNRCDELDDLRSIQPTSRQNNNRRPTVHGHVAATQETCPFCQEASHKLHECSKFIATSVSERHSWIQSQRRCFNCLNINHGVFNCKAKSRCKDCTRKHHSLLHPANLKEPSSSSVSNLALPSRDDKDNQGKSEQPTEASYHVRTIEDKLYTILPTAMVNILNQNGEAMGKARLLLDCGSQVSFISEAFAKRHLMPIRQQRILVHGVGEAAAGSTKGVVKMVLASTQSADKLFVEAFVLSKITTKLPQYSINRNELQHLIGINLADPDFHESRDVDILLGADHFFTVLREGNIKTISNKVIAQNTVFGWVVAGPAPALFETISMLGMAAVVESVVERIDESLRALWEVERVPERSSLSRDEEACEKMYMETTKRNVEGRFVVHLPFKGSPDELGSTYTQAVRRLNAMEKRFTRDNEFAQLYRQFMTDYEQLGHMREIRPEELGRTAYYTPHHGVLTQTVAGSKKLRVVFDASVKSTTQKSLNDILLVGPTVQSLLYSILLRYRTFRFVFAADVQQMYRQILVRDEDAQFQRIVWRAREEDPIKQFTLRTVTYGTAAAPYLATRSVKQLAMENKTKYPIAACKIEHDVYVDDLMTGCRSVQELKTLKKDIVDIFKSCGMVLKKWISNCPELLQEIPTEDVQLSKKEFNNGDLVKVLGMRWDPKDDVFTFTIKLSIDAKCTKRAVLSEASRVFDPLGLIAPCIIQIKILLQDLWREKLDWDDQLPEPLRIRWLKMRGELGQLQCMSIPRWLNAGSSVEIHGFCDASTVAYGAAVYTKTIDCNGSINIHLVTSKSKVAPIASRTIPELELCAALLLARLLRVIEAEMNVVRITSITAWTDSTIVLDWFTGYPSVKIKEIFVRNRVAATLELYGRNIWNHIKSEDNPADIVSRGLSPRELNDNNIWWHGPIWLKNSPQEWPVQQYEYHPVACPSITNHHVEIAIGIVDSMATKYSKFVTTSKVIAWIIKFCQNAKTPSTLRTPLNRIDIEHAEFVIFRAIQRDYFGKELAGLRENQVVPSQSRLKFLNPIIDAYGILRVGGRIQNSLMEFNIQHPIILDGKSWIIRKLVEEHHIKYRHAGPTLMLSILRQRYFIVGLRRMVKTVVRQCVKCFKAKPTLSTQEMAALPDCRVKFTRPFTKVGVDYAGPLSAYLTRRRGQRAVKVYICIFVCLSVKAVHIELVNDLTSESFLAALRRMVSRRGICTDLYSDCGTNFVGANKILAEWYHMLEVNKEHISNSLLGDKINWHFNPPRAPHFGGIWEAAVKSVKVHLTRVIGANVLTIEELTTLLIEIEALLNSRPLCHGDSNDDVDILTPAHFLIGENLLAIPEPRCEATNYTARWRMVKQLVQDFSTRWHKEYLTLLQHRYKWFNKSKNVQVGDIVLIKDDNWTATRWPMGKVKAVFPGKDGLVRTATIRTQLGELKRPIHKLAVIPLGESDDSRGPGC